MSEVNEVNAISEVNIANDICNTNKIEEKVTIIEHTKPKIFRCINYDQYDVLYASHMKRMYTYVENNIKIEFTKFTEHLIDEENAISRNKLLDAIDEFKDIFLKNNDTNSNNDYKHWVRFTDEAFNYRPYQPCIIS